MIPEGEASSSIYIWTGSMHKKTLSNCRQTRHPDRVGRWYAERGTV